MSKTFLKAAVGLQALPEKPETLSRFINWGRRGHILGQIAAVWEEKSKGKLHDILLNARLWTQHDKKMLTYEMNRLCRALDGTDIKPVLLKGGAYVAKALTAAEGRRVSDIDILVAEEDIPAVEKALKAADWIPESSTDNSYDQHYYRDWMHELPPLRHRKRRTLIDVHHRLLPRTARLQPDHKAMLAASQPMEKSRLRVFQPIDRFIHSAIHIFSDGAFETPARSLIELYYLFHDLDSVAKQQLAVRAAEMRAEKPVRYALWAIWRFFDDIGAKAILSTMPIAYFDWPVRLVISLAVNGRVTQLATFFLYARSHFLRMPFMMLVRHLFTKTFRSKEKPVQVSR